jgi:hypothetical protein
MGFRTHHEIICDGCCENGPMTTLMAASNGVAKARGWLIRKDYPHHLCPKCLSDQKVQKILLESLHKEQ